MNEDEIHVLLTIFDYDIEPEEITNLTGIKPTSVWIKGARHEHGNHERPILHNAWRLYAKSTGADTAESQLQDLLKQLEPCGKVIADLAHRYEATITISMMTHDPQPGALLTPDILKKISKLGVCLEVNVYPLSESSGKNEITE